MKLYYRVSPKEYKEMLSKVKEKFQMHEEIDEDKTFLMLDDESQIEIVRASYDPTIDDTAHVQVVIHDESLKTFFDSIFGIPYKIKR